MLNILQYHAWALEPRFFNMAAIRVMRAYAKGTNLDELAERNRSQMAARYHGRNVAFQNGIMTTKTKKGANVAIIPVLGTLTKRGDLCAYGMRDYMNITQNAIDMNVDGIVYDMEGPGGTVDGTPEFGEFVKNSPIPILTFGDGMVASADYWIASQSAHIMSNKLNATEFGSIGVLQMHENWSKWIEENIGSIEIMRAEKSKDKARVNFIEALQEEQREGIQQELNGWQSAFANTVQSGRGEALKNVDEDVFTGKMYRENLAKKYGLIDSIGTFSEAIEKAVKLNADANKHPVSVDPKQVNNQNSNYMFSKIFGDSSESAQKLTADEKTKLASAEEKLIKAEAENGLLKEQLANATQLAGELKADAKAKDTKIAELEAKLADTPAAETPRTTEAEDPKPQSEDEQQKIIDNLPHNKSLDEQYAHLNGTETELKPNK